MADLYQVGGQMLDRLWPQVDSLWRRDSKYRNQQSAAEVRHWVMLGEAQLWLVIEHSPANCSMEDRRFLKRHPEGRVWAAIITCRLKDRLVAQLACGRDAGKWASLAMARLTKFADGLPLAIYLRYGWRRFFAMPSYPIRMYRDPGVLCVRCDQPPRRGKARSAGCAA